MTTAWYRYDQNPTGSDGMIVDGRSGSEVWVQATTRDDADERFRALGFYFYTTSCQCCGHRWEPQFEDPDSVTSLEAVVARRRRTWRDLFDTSNPEDVEELAYEPYPNDRIDPDVEHGQLHVWHCYAVDGTHTVVGPTTVPAEVTVPVPSALLALLPGAVS